MSIGLGFFTRAVIASWCTTDNAARTCSKSRDFRAMPSFPRTSHHSLYPSCIVKQTTKSNSRKLDTRKINAPPVILPRLCPKHIRKITSCPKQTHPTYSRYSFNIMNQERKSCPKKYKQEKPSVLPSFARSASTFIPQGWQGCILSTRLNHRNKRQGIICNITVTRAHLA